LLLWAPAAAATVLKRCPAFHPARDAVVAAAGVDALTLARYANAVLAGCQALLEDEAAPPAALPPLLAVLQQAARHKHSLKCVALGAAGLLAGMPLWPCLVSAQSLTPMPAVDWDLPPRLPAGLDSKTLLTCC
jgi:hypothetical protein